jgi:hypothetical protein
MRKRIGTESGTVRADKENAIAGKSAKALSRNDVASSWGETRTPDPGIMSAVL